MSNTQRLTGGSSKNHTIRETTKTGYRVAKQIKQRVSSDATTATMTVGDTVGVSRTEGSVRVRLIPVPSGNRDSDTTE